MLINVCHNPESIPCRLGSSVRSSQQTVCPSASAYVNCTRDDETISPVLSCRNCLHSCHGPVLPGKTNDRKTASAMAETSGRTRSRRQGTGRRDGPRRKRHHLGGNFLHSWRRNHA